MLVEQICCIITVSETSFCKELGPPQSPQSCSGVILNYQTGLVLCSGMAFSPFLIDKECVSKKQKRILHANNFSSTMRISVDHVDMTVNRTSSKLCVTEGCHERQNAGLVMMLNCLEFQRAFEKIFREADKWNFYGGDEDPEIFDSVFLSWFAVLKMPSLAQGKTVSWVKSTAIEKGCSVLACGSPFGSFCPDLFMSTLSKGIVSNLAGEENAVIMTDARCLPGTEGGGLFVIIGDTPCLVGLITSPLCWKSHEWIGLTIVCSVHLILKNLLQAITFHQSLGDFSACSLTDIPQVLITANQNSAKGKYPMVAVVESGQWWGSGVMLNPHLVLTCRHVVNGNPSLTVRVNARERYRTWSGRVLYTSKVSSPYDLAVVQLEEPVLDVVAPRLATSFHSGEDVVVLGYGALGKHCGPSVTSGILSRVITYQKKPVMLQTTCAVQCGASGGAIIRTSTGELLGIVSSNTRDFAAKVTYPHLNFSIPVSVLEPLLSDFAHTGDTAVFQALDSAEEEVTRVWRLHIPQSKL
ncbi:peroxisomal leader peptide-processing protease [Electrophorus electricus]|uniref:Peroxisomal leader peptide-processing protease n=1 Tax=Electrophorus electricus TaxID=8005 RepID=A0A4W4DQD7_ELEEL|nr:peroxisomal leader peptide-processing protease [Electrophorus electricus]